MKNKTADTSIDNSDVVEQTTTDSDKVIDNTLQTQASSAAISMVKQPMPKRLTALCTFLVISSISGLIAKQGELFCILTIIMVIAILGRQRTAMYFLRGYTSLQLILVSMLPVYLYDPNNLLVGNPSTFKLGQLQAKIPDFIIFSILIFLAIVQVWIAFTPKVKGYFNTKINMNIMS